ncbi:MAG: septum site-determining protein MinC [Steroidobacteraceae bacterium]
MNKPAHAVPEPACEIRFSQVGITQVRIRTTDVNELHAELGARLKAAPQLFERSGVCVDFGALETVPDADKARALVEAVRWAGMLPVGIAQGSEQVEALARALDLPLLTPSRAAQKSPPETGKSKSATVAQKATDEATPTLVHQQPVRSGQRVYAAGRDLIVTSAIGAGAEVMADGCVHVYGVLRGRALAGARGDVAARVFSQEFRAELVSIAGVFRVFESLPPELEGKPVQAWLQGEQLHFAPVGD